MTNFSSAPPPAPTYGPHHEAMFDKLSATQQRKLALDLIAYVGRWQGNAHLVHCFPVLEKVWEDPQRSGGYPIDFVPAASEVLPAHNNRETVTFGDPSPYTVNPLVWK